MANSGYRVCFPAKYGVLNATFSPLSPNLGRAEVDFDPAQLPH